MLHLLAEVILVAGSAASWAATPPTLIRPTDGDKHLVYGSQIALASEWFITTSGCDDGAELVIHLQNRSAPSETAEQFSVDGLLVDFALNDQFAVIVSRKYGQDLMNILQLSTDSWVQVAALPARVREKNLMFGRAIVLSEQQLIVAGRESANVVYVYGASDTGIQLVQRITREQASDEPLMFGAALAADRDILAVGTPHLDAPFAMIELYRRVEGRWAFAQRIIPTDEPGLRYPEATWGSALHLQDDLLVLSSVPDPLEDAPCMLAVYRLDGDQFAFDGSITGPTTSKNSRFGWSVAVHAGEILVGDPGAHHSDGTASGAVYRYTREEGEWILAEKLEPPEAQHDQCFGIAVATDGKCLLIGSPALRGDDQNIGGIYVYPVKQINQSKQ